MTEVEKLIEIYKQLEKDGLMVTAGKKSAAERMVSHDVVPVVRCQNCINGIYDDTNNIYKCVKSADYDPEYDDWLGFVSYHNADYYCADGERRTDGR